MERPRDLPPLWAEAPLVLVHLAVAWGFGRVFTEGWSFTPLASVVLAAHALAIAARRSHLPAPVAALVAVAGLPVVLALAILGDTTAWGLPTAATWDAARAALAEARTAFPEVVAPTDPLPGFLLAAGVGLWLAAWFGDWTAHRVGATIEPIGTATALFACCTVLGSGEQAVAAALAFGAAAVAFVAVQRASAARADHEWMAGREAAARRLAVGGVALGALALLVGAVVGPQLPGADADPLIDWRDRGDQARRVTVSPMVELRRRLVEQTDQLLFEVRTDAPSYWRLTSLDRFDGEVWSSDGSFRPATRRLPSDAPSPADATSIDQRIRIRALSAIWVPVAFEAVSLLDASEGLRWDPASSTLIVESSRSSSDGLTYSVVSRAPALDPAALAQVDPVDPAEITGRYAGLPVDFPDEARRLAGIATRGATTRYDQARALQDWFRTAFTYSLEAPAGHGSDALLDFLADRTGYCEQFAGAFAAMGRALGMPTRVAVGFTPGSVDPTDPQRYLVLGRHAHAWPEVYFPEVGWVPFEPTPGRGIPGAQAHTGVAPEQDVGGAPAATTTSTTTTTAPTSPEPSTTEPDADLALDAEAVAPEAPDAPADGASAGPAPPGGWLLAAGIGALGAVAVVLARRRRGPGEPEDALEQGWHRVGAALAGAGIEAPSPAETPLEVADRARPHLAPATAASLDALAEAITAGRWATGAHAEAARRDALARVDDLIDQLGRPADAAVR